MRNSAMTGAAITGTLSFRQMNQKPSIKSLALNGHCPGSAQSGTDGPRRPRYWHPRVNGCRHGLDTLKLERDPGR